MVIIQFLARLIAVLRSAATPAQVGGGFIFGMAIGLVPSFPIKALLFICLILINVNIAIALFAMFVFGLIAYLLDPLFHSVGFWLLVRIDVLEPLWAALYNIPFVPFTNFNNTVVMGAMICSILLLYPVYVGVKAGVIGYREKIEPVAGKWKVVQLIQRSTLYTWFRRLSRLGEELL
ncbi:MAG: TIGR03546 family protein [Chitinispirillaceae bacterium]